MKESKEIETAPKKLLPPSLTNALLLAISPSSLEHFQHRRPSEVRSRKFVCKYVRDKTSYKRTEA
jgi:hypothetical protein